MNKMQNYKKKFDTEYKKLNTAQKKAVDTIDGPVMVIAGPGTGKTQILALRIGNILLKTDAKADSILCLTFTNSGVKAMRDRLEEYIGSDAHNVRISTFHGFGIELIGKYYDLLDFKKIPELLADDGAVFLIDDILHDGQWEYLSPRARPEMYFKDLKQLIAILKRERLMPEEFLNLIESDIENLKNDEKNISSRGAGKGKLKKEVEKKIEALSRTKEVVEFYRIYEEKKHEAGLMDYDDVLEYMVGLAEDYEDVRADIFENYQYVLVDEHQDSSGVQNEFLKAVWKGTDMPNIFVVGDDRQLIYAFAGAKLSYFEEFAHLFGKTKSIVLTENYRSTKSILSLADDLLRSSISEGKLRSNTSFDHKIYLRQYAYPRDEILGAGLYFKSKIKEGVTPEECVLLVPKNHHVRSAVQMLADMGVPVASGKNLSLFNTSEAQSFLRIMRIVSNPYDSISVSESLLDKYSGVETLEAHKFLNSSKKLSLTIENLINNNNTNLFAGENTISQWGCKLKNWLNSVSGEKISVIVSMIGNEFLIDASKEHKDLIRNVEVVRSFIHLATLFEEKDGSKKLSDFLIYLKRLESYGSHINVASFGKDSGVSVMTLHKSKGLEYKVVWIAHANEEVIMSEKKGGFSLPEKVKVHMESRDIESVKRELYVAITRAKEFCNISYASEDYGGRAFELARIIQELPSEHFIKKDQNETERELLEHGPRIFAQTKISQEINVLRAIQKFVKENYAEAKVSVSLLNNFFECPWKWYFRNFLKLPEVKGVSLAFGSAVHSVIEQILKNKTLPNIADIKNKINIELKKEGIEDPLELKKLSKDAENAVAHFVDHYYKNLEQDYVSERPIQFRDPKFPQLLMFGLIDLTETSASGDIQVTDFKTGKSKTKNIIEKLDKENRMSGLLRQLAMYSYLIRGSSKGRNVNTSRLLFLEANVNDKNALYAAHISSVQIDMLLKDIADYEKSLQSGNWINRTCYYNGYGDQSECGYCKRADIYKTKNLG